MKIIDPTAWPRRDHYAWFRSLDYPYVAVTFEVDVTRLKEARGSLFAGMSFAILEAVNAVPELRQRIRVGDDGADVVVEHDSVDAGVTVDTGDGLFTYVCMERQAEVGAWAEVVRAATASVAGRPHLDPFDGGRDDLVYLSCLPWIRFTEIAHPMPTNRARPDSVPRISWGKVVQEGGRFVGPVNIQAHHALVDGVHLGRFVQALEARLAGGER